MSRRYDPFVFGGLSTLVNASRALHEMMAHLVEDDKTRPDPEIIREVHAVMVDFFGAWTAHYIQFSRANGREPVIIVDGWRQGLEGDKAREYLEHFTPIHNIADQLCHDWGWTAPFSSRERVLPLEKLLEASGAPVRPACTRSQLEEVGAHVDVIGRPIPVIPRIPVGVASSSPQRWVDLAGCQRWQLDCPYFASGSIEPSPPGAGVLVRADAVASPRPDVEYRFVLKAKDGDYYAFGASRWEWFPVVARDIGTDMISTMPEQHGDLLRIHPSERVLVALTAGEALNLLVESNHFDALPDDLETLLGADSASRVPGHAAGGRAETPVAADGPRYAAPADLDPTQVVKEAQPPTTIQSSTSHVRPNSEPNPPPESARIAKDKNIEERDKFIYDQCIKSVKYSSIINLVKKNNDWEHIGTPQGIKDAAKRYAERHDLSLPGRRKRGRPKGEK